MSRLCKSSCRSDTTTCTQALCMPRRAAFRMTGSALAISPESSSVANHNGLSHCSSLLPNDEPSYQKIEIVVDEVKEQMVQRQRKGAAQTESSDH